MEFRQLRVFESVVTHGTVTDAAVALGRAPSSVSEQIRVLEASLDVSLFDRTPGGLRLTAAGERMTGWARRLLAEAEEARREVTGVPAVVRLGALETIAATHVPGALEQLALRRPDVTVQVRSDASRGGLLAGVADGTLDAALLLDSGSSVGGLGFTAPSATLDFADLSPVPLALVAAPDHPLAGRDRLSLDDLHGCRLLVNNAPECSFTLAGQQLLRDHVERVPTGGVTLIRACAERGIGIALLPLFAVSAQLDSGTLTLLPFDVPELSLRLVWRPDREHAPGVRDMLYAMSAA
jgi:DNA-binding transcriptional LysR family regulator